jgi:hypothetical protein
MDLPLIKLSFKLVKKKRILLHEMPKFQIVVMASRSKSHSLSNSAFNSMQSKEMKHYLFGLTFY